MDSGEIDRGFDPAELGAYGEIGARMQAHAERSAALGDPRASPQAFRTLLSVVLACRQPMFLAWGPDRLWFYNDAFIPILGDKHPRALGRPSREVWSEAWAQLEPMFDRVFSGEPVSIDGYSLDLERYGKLEEAHFDFSYTPARDEHGAVVALFGVCVETTERVTAEKRRRLTAAERQRRQFEQAPGFIIIMRGPDHVVDFVNDVHRATFGSDDWLGWPIRQAFPSLEGQGLFEALDEVFATGKVFEAQAAPVNYKRGRNRPVEERYLTFIYSPLTDDDGRITGVFCEGFDVTDQARGEEARRAANIRQAVLVELADRFRDVSDPADLSYAAAELLGMALNVSRAGYGTIDPRRETIAIERDWNAPGIRSLAGVLHFRDYGSYIEELKRGVTVVITDSETDPRTAANGAALKGISAQALVNMPVTEQGGFVALLYLNHHAAREWTPDELTLIREVAERTRMAVERRRAEEDLRTLAASLEQQVAERTADRDRVWRNSRDLLVVIGADGVFRAVNPAWSQILGHDPSDVVGRSFLEFIWPEDAAMTQGGLDVAVYRHDLTDFENRYTHKDGSPRWISWHTSAEGDIVFAYGRDITAQKVAQAELVAAQEALRQSQKMEAVGQLTGGLAHDFNNLLMGISGSLELLERRLAQGRLDGVDRYISGAQGGARRAANLTQRLLAFSRRQTLDSRPIEVSRLIAGMAELIERSTGPDVELVVRNAPDLWPTKADASQLESSLLNLCINARDAMAPNGGRLLIETANQQFAAKVGELKAGEYVSIAVTDTGAGMPPAVAARAFDPFFTTKPRGEGTGLGLSMVYGFVRQSGGQVRIDSTEGAGATVTLYLPRFMGQIEEDEAEGEAGLDPAAGETVLVIDDEETIRLLIRDVLEEAGYSVLEASDGPAGLEVMQSRAAVDLLITDVGLPGGVNGRQVADAARLQRPGLKTLFITGFAESAAVSSDQLEPGMEVITKPFAMSALAQKVREMLDQ